MASSFEYFNHRLIALTVPSVHDFVETVCSRSINNSLNLDLVPGPQFLNPAHAVSYDLRPYGPLAFESQALLIVRQSRTSRPLISISRLQPGRRLALHRLYQRYARTGK